MTPTIYIDELLKDDKIIALIEKSNEFYWLSAVSVQNNEYSKDELTSICRLILVITNYALACDDNRYAEKAYKALKSIKISDQDTREIFDSIVGYDLTDSSLIYYFYLSSLALKLNKTISARLDLTEFNDSNAVKDEMNWNHRVLSGIFESLILLIRKANGFSDIQSALKIINHLQQEQKNFEGQYIAKLDYREQTAEALSLVSLYHTSKALTETAEYLIQGYEYPKRIDAVVRQHIDIALKLQSQDTRLIDFINFIWRDLQILIQNSIWTGTSFHDKIKKLCQLKSQNSILELLPSQRQALNENLFNVAANAIILQMPTSAGKTLLAEFNIIVTKSLRSDARIVYIVPSRALVNQVYFDLREDLSELGIKVEKTSSANEVDPTENDFLLSDDIDVLVSTPEKIDLLIRRQHSSVEDVSLFIIDEAHSLENGQRGARLELLVAMLRKERPNAKYMLLSPFLPGDKESLKDWLGGGNTIQVDWKPSDKVIVGLNVKTKTAIIETLPSPYCSSSIPIIKQKFQPTIALSSIGKSRVLEFACKYFAEQGKTQLILCAGRGSANKQAKKIAEWLEIPDVISDDVRLVQKYMNEEIGCETLFTQLLSKGVTVHHAGLSDESKVLIEHLIRNKHIQYVCSTSTIAEGVNFPVSSVYFDSYEKGKGNRLSSNDFWNIAGRAGRTMVDDFGKIILPFNSPNNRQIGINIIEKSAEELTSVLAELFIQQDIVRQQLSQDNNGVYNLLRLYPESFGPLFQYFVHLLNVSHNEYVEDVEDLFKDSLAYHMLDSEDKRAQFIDLCRYIYQSIELKFSNSHGALKFADKTGFSVPSVLQIMHEKANSRDVSDLESWQPQNIFNRQNPQSLTQKIKVISALRETNLGTESKSAPLNPELIARMIIGWVKGDKLNSISAIHPYFQGKDTDERVTDFVSYMNGVRFKASWGLSALEGIVNGEEDELRDSYIPSFVYYGVEDKKSLAMRMMGVPRSLSNSLSRIVDGKLSEYSFSKLRERIHSLTSRDWDDYKPQNSALSGQEWKNIMDILMK